MTQLIFHNFFSFIFIMSIIVFVHEFGHFYVARLCGVKVETFSIGFGKEIFGFNDKKQTRWKFCYLPFGGYVKMYGDQNEASSPDFKKIANMTYEEKKQSFIGKSVYQKFAIVAAGPVANFVMAIFLLTFLFQINGLNKVLPIVGEVGQNSAAYEAGIKSGDEILEIDNNQINEFSDLQKIITASVNKELLIKIKRDEKILAIKAIPKYQVSKNIFGEEMKVGMLGITASKSVNENLNLWQSFKQSCAETYKISISILQAISELITGERSVKELSGPIKIAKYSGQTMEMGFMVVVWFMAMISINLGVANLLPIPVLDGGHLFFYAIEIIFRKPIPEKLQQIAFKIGMALVLALMSFTIFNDISNVAGFF